MSSSLRRYVLLAGLMAALLGASAIAGAAGRASADPVIPRAYLPLIIGGTPRVAGCPLQPADNIWNRAVDTLPVDANSAKYVSAIGGGKSFHADFGSGQYEDAIIGIPYNVVGIGQATYTVTFDYDGESDPGPYPIPSRPIIEGDPIGGGDRHLLTVDTSTCKLYELYAVYTDTHGLWYAGSGAIFDLNSNALRPNGWTSADAAGLPILPGLARYEEVAAGEIRHALRFTVPTTNGAKIWPARHVTSSSNLNAPPMGQRFRLKASFNVAQFQAWPQAYVLAVAMQKYGLIVADNGSAWYVSGAPDPGWDNDVLHKLDFIHGSDFEAVNEAGLMVDPNSGQAR
jgi:hypothetical protein